MAEKHFQEEVNRFAELGLGLYHRLHDLPQKAQFAKPWDCQWLYSGAFHAIELKFSWGDEPLPFDELKVHQRDALLAAEAEGHQAWLLVCWRGQARPLYCKQHGLERDAHIELVYAIPAMNAIRYQQSAERGGWSIAWAAEHGYPVPKRQAGRSWTWDLEVLHQVLEREMRVA